MTRPVRLHPLAEADLFDLYDYIVGESGPTRAGAFIGTIEKAMYGLAEFPEKGRRRDDIATGIRTIAVARRALVAYRLSDQDIVVLRVLYAGRDFSNRDIPD